MTGRTASTFAALTRLGDFKADAAKPSADDNRKDEDEDSEQETDRDTKKMTGLRTEFHYNIQIHLPSNGTEETYLNIFNAVRKTFQ